MSEWEFLWELEGEELIEAMTSGGTEADWEYGEEMWERWEQKAREEQRLQRKQQWQALKIARDKNEISREEFRERKLKIFGK